MSINGLAKIGSAFINNILSTQLPTQTTLPVSFDQFEQNRLNRETGHRIADAVWTTFRPVAITTGVFEDDLALFMIRFGQSAEHIKKRKTEEMLMLAEQESILAKQLAQNVADTKCQTQLANVRQALEKNKQELQAAQNNSGQERQIISHIRSASHEQIINSFRTIGGN